MLKYIVLTSLAVGALLAAACGSSASEGGQLASSELAPDAPSKVKIGNEIGNRLPNFELTLTSNGEKLTSTSLVESGRPAFLFFFATT